MGMLGVPGRLRNDLPDDQKGRIQPEPARTLAPEDPSRYIASTTNGDHEVWFEVIEDPLRRCLTQFVDLETIEVS